MYGESTEESGSDATFSLDEDGSGQQMDITDDESTLRAAEAEEAAARNLEDFVADPVELRQLREEAGMDLDKVLERLQDNEPTQRRRRVVQFDVAGDNDDDSAVEADDDMDASDVEDYRNDDDDSEEDDDDDANEEFEPDETAVDDETTMEAEEKLGRDMSHEEEIALLNRENEMTVEELRAMYVGMEEDEAAAVEEQDDVEEEEDSDDAGSEEFEPEETVDDETTMEAEEKLGRDMSHEEEIALLNRENEMSVEELRAMYAGMEDDEAAVEEQDDNEEEDSDDAGSEEFEPEETVDDETTMEAEEKLGRDMSHEEEIALLNRENEMSVEELRAMYAGMEEEKEAVEQEAEESESESGEPKSSPRRSKRRRTHDDDDGGSDEGRKKQKAEMDKSSKTESGDEALDKLEASAELARRTRVSRPFLIPSWVKLREYQQIGLNWLVSLQSRRLNGILADEMGLVSTLERATTILLETEETLALTLSLSLLSRQGKTLQTISLLAYLASYKGIWGPHLIVVPTSVILNWETELKRFCPGLKVLCYYGSAKRRKELRTGWTKSNWYHVVITSYQLVVQDAFAFKRKRWCKLFCKPLVIAMHCHLYLDRWRRTDCFSHWSDQPFLNIEFRFPDYLVLDEAQHIKNFQSQRWQTLINFNTQRRLLLTG